jgi:hypothetical protein
MEPFADSLRRVTPLLALVACLAAVVAAVGLWRLGAEAAERTCIERAEAQYPAVAVSSSAARNSPVRLSYDRERRDAVAKCD